jgi:hypothetical protein
MKRDVHVKHLAILLILLLSINACKYKSSNKNNKLFKASLTKVFLEDTFFYRKMAYAIKLTNDFNDIQKLKFQKEKAYIQSDQKDYKGIYILRSVNSSLVEDCEVKISDMFPDEIILKPEDSIILIFFKENIWKNRSQNNLQMGKNEVLKNIENDIKKSKLYMIAGKTDSITVQLDQNLSFIFRPVYVDDIIVK